MPIIDLQRRLHEAGRIRIGEQVAATKRDGSPTTRPGKLETFRFTSSNEEAIKAIAGILGGIPALWDDAPTGKQWEVVTDSSTVRVLVPPEGMAFSQFYELWSGGGCSRRCDGVHLVPSDDPCVCDPDNRECKPHTRVSVMLADFPTSGLWRLDTQGYYAAVEMSGGFELASLIAQASNKAMLGATLRLDQREVKRPGQQTRKFAVPVIDFDLDVRAFVGDTPSLPPSGITPLPSLPAPSFAEQLADVAEFAPRPARANAAEPIKPTGVKPRTVVEAGPTVIDMPAQSAAPTAGPGDATQKQLGMIAKLFKDKGFPDDKDIRHNYVVAIIKRQFESTKELTKREASNVIESLMAESQEAEQFDDEEAPF